MSSPTPASLLAALTSLRPRADGAATRVIVLPAAPETQNAEHTLAPPPRSAPVSPLRRVLPLVTASVRAIVRNPRARQLALAVLARSPRLHAHALRLTFRPDPYIALDAIPLEPALAAALSPRARLAARRLQLAPPAAITHPLPAPSDAAGWDQVLAGLAGAPARRAARPRLAFVSPLPPERTGVADYAVQLLPALCAWFDVELVVAQEALDLPPELSVLPVRDPVWLKAHAHEFDHILYQIGNSEFHSHMFALLRDHPGVVVLHDFFLGNVMAYRQAQQDPAGAWTGALFHAHGFSALHAYQQAGSRQKMLKSLPCNLAVLEQATAVIAHSTHAAELARAWYGNDATRNWHTVPLPRAAPPAIDRAAARAALGIGADVFLVCSFGYIGQNKLTDRLLAAWLASSLHSTHSCLLVLVGANHNSPFGVQIAGMVRSAKGSVRIAGWSDDTVYRQYLQAADLGVQLRTNAQGETSAAVLDCMNYGLSTIVNANGSMAALPPDAVLRLPDVFEDAVLTAALETLHDDSARRAALGMRAAHLLAAEYRPEHGAARYTDVLNRQESGALERPLGALVSGRGDAVIAAAAAALARRPHQLHVRQLLVDIGAGTASDAQHAAMLLAPCGMRVELVRLQVEDGAWRVRYARSHAAALLGLSWQAPEDPLADLDVGDVLYIATPSSLLSSQAGAQFCAALRAGGVALAFGTPAGAGPAWRAAAMPLADLLVCPDDASAEAWHATGTA